MAKVSTWKAMWRRGQASTAERLRAHERTVRQLLGGAPDGWLARVHPAVAAQLAASPGRAYSGRDIADLVRAIRNLFEHCFDRARAIPPASYLHYG